MAWNIPRYGKTVTVGADTSVSRGTQFTPATGSWGSYAEITSSSPIDANAITLMVNAVANTASVSFMIGLAVGAASSEQLIVDYMPFPVSSGRAYYAFLPIGIPAGTRIAIRGRYSGANAPLVDAAILLHAGSLFPIKPLAGIVNLAGDSWGPTLGTGYVQVTASTAIDVKWLMPRLTTQGSTPGSVRARVGIGGAAAEQLLIDYWPAQKSSTAWFEMSPGWPVDVPAGTRAAMRIDNTGPSFAGTLMGGFY